MPKTGRHKNRPRSCQGRPSFLQHLWGATVAAWATRASGRRKDGRAWLKMKCECDLNEYVLVHTWYIQVQTGLYKVSPKVWRADMVLTLDCGILYCACGTCILWYPSISTQVHPLKNVHVMQMVHTCMYWVHTSTYLYVQGLPKTFWGYSFVTFDYGLWYAVCWTCRQWCKKAKTVSKSMSNLHVTFPVHTRYIPVHTYMYHLINHVPVCTGMYRYVPGMYLYVPNTLILYIWSGFQMNEIRLWCNYMVYYMILHKILHNHYMTQNLSCNFM